MVAFVAANHADGEPEHDGFEQRRKNIDVRNGPEHLLNIGRETGFVKRKLNVFNNKFINTNQALLNLRSTIIMLIYNILNDLKKVINIEIVFKLLTVAFLKFITRRGNLSG